MTNEERVKAGMRAAFTAVMEQDQWDMAPELAYVFEGPDGTVELGAMEINPRGWIGRPTIESIRMLAERTRQPGCPNVQVQSDHKFIGLALLNEGWALYVDAHDAEAVARGQAAGEAHIIHDLPDRIEVRLLTLVTTDGTSYGIQQRRDIDTEVPDVVVSGGADGVERASGAVQDALLDLATALDTRMEYVELVRRD